MALLQATFGGDPDGWYDLPYRKLRMYMQMVPRIEARRRLELVNAFVIANTVGAKDSSEPRRILRRWHQLAYDDSEDTDLSEDEWNRQLARLRGKPLDDEDKQPGDMTPEQYADYFAALGVRVSLVEVDDGTERR